MPCGYQAFVRLSSASQRKPPRRPWARRAAHGAPKPRPNGSMRRSRSASTAASPAGAAPAVARLRRARAAGGTAWGRSCAALGRVGWSPRTRWCHGAGVALRAVSVAARPPDPPQHRAARRPRWPPTRGCCSSSAAVASLTLVAVLGVKGLLGLGPAIVLASGALAALPAGRAMDRFGRVPGARRRASASASRGCGLAALGSALPSAPAVLAGLVRSSARRAAPRCWRAPRRATCTRPSGARTASRSCSSGRCSARSSARSSSARCSPAASSTATRSPGCGWPRAASCSPGWCSCSPSGPTRRGSPSCCAPTPRARSRRRRRCARSCAAPARSRRCWPARRRSR